MKVWEGEAKWNGALGELWTRSALFILTWGCKPVFNFAFQIWANENLNTDLEPKWLIFIRTIFCVHVFHRKLDKIQRKPCPAWFECEPQWAFSKSSEGRCVFGKKPLTVAIKTGKKMFVCMEVLTCISVSAFHRACSGEGKKNHLDFGYVSASSCLQNVF